MRVLAALLFFTFGLTARAEFEVPRLTGPVVDEAGLIAPQDRQDLERALRRYRDQGRAQIQVLIVPTLDGLTVEEAAIKVFDRWKLGDEKTDRGILFLISTGDKRMRFEVGQGLEGVIPDIEAKRILADQVAPLFRAGRASTGVMVGVSEVISLINGEADGASPAIKKSPDKDKFIMAAVILIFIIVQVLRVMAGGGVAYRGARRRGVWTGGGGFGGGGFGGGGGWSGGGGSSSGGGASSGW